MNHREPVTFAPGVLAEMSRSAIEAAPMECCGVLIGTISSNGCEVSEFALSRNVAISKSRYQMNPADYRAAERRAEQFGQLVLGVFHSHPDGNAEPSETDRAHAIQLWENAPSWMYLICGLGETNMPQNRAWRLIGGRFYELQVNSSGEVSEKSEDSGPTD